MNAAALEQMGDGEVGGNESNAHDSLANTRLELELGIGRAEYCEHQLDLIRRYYTASDDDRDWFLAHPERKTRIRRLNAIEVRRDLPSKSHIMQDPTNVYLVVVDRIRPMSGCSFLGYGAISEAEARNHVVVIAEPFPVDRAQEELTLIERMESVVGEEMLDKVVGAWIASHVAPTWASAERGEKPCTNRLRFDSFYAIAERICPAHMQAVKVGRNGFPLA